MERYHFTALPFHEPPRHLESFTGYLSWIACSNEMSDIVEIANIFYPKQVNSIQGGGLTDFPPLSTKTLCASLACSEQRLLATTFYFLAPRFGRDTGPQTLGKFLSGSLSSSLRYCPPCIREKGHYSLLWRFTDLAGCGVHGCRLLDACHNPECGLAIPFWSTSPSEVCPSCRCSLADAPVQPLTHVESESVRKLASSLKFLLAPPRGSLQRSLDKESSLAVARQVGNRLRSARERRGWTRKQVAALTGLASYQVKGAEAGKIHQQGASFQTYLRFAQCLDMPLVALVAEHIWNQWSARPPGSPKLFEASTEEYKEETHEGRLVSKVEMAILKLQQSGSPVTQQAVCAQMGLSRKHLMKFKTAKAKLLELPYIRTKKRVGCVTYQEREEVLLARVRTAIEELQQSGVPLTRITVAKKLHYSTAALYHYQRVKDLLDEVIPTTKEALRRRTDARVDVLLLRITDAVKTIKAKGNRVTAKAIYSTSGLSSGGLIRYPEVVARIKQLVLDCGVDKSAERRAREEELRSRIEEIIADLRGKGLSVTQHGVCRVLGLSPAGLQKYESVRMLLDALKADGDKSHRRRNEATLAL
jgi:transcriptional regulator with XRE-family HTH domain